MRVIRKFAPITIELETEHEVKFLLYALDALLASEEPETYLKERKGLSIGKVMDLADFIEDLRRRI